MIQVWTTDKQGFFTGESKFVKEEEVTELTIINPILTGYVKTKWNGEDWEEGATVEEIKAWKDANKPKEKEVDKIDILVEKIDIIKDYKWEISARGFEYDGYIQSNKERDCTMMYRCRMGLELGVEPYIPWKLPDETYAIITDSNYFLQMEILSTKLIQKCFGVEEVIINELKQLETIEELLSYNEKARFDELFNSIQ